MSRVATAIDGKVAPVVKNLPTNSGDARVLSLDGDRLEEEMATHSSILA